MRISLRVTLIYSKLEHHLVDSTSVEHHSHPTRLHAMSTQSQHEFAVASSNVICAKLGERQALAISLTRNIIVNRQNYTLEPT